MSDRQNGYTPTAPAFDSLDARAVMGCLLFYGDRAVAEVDSPLSESLFFDPLTKWTYRAFEALRANGDPADAITVTGWLRDHKKLELVGGAAEIAVLCGDGAANPSTIRTHLDKLRDQEAQRQCMEAVQHLSAVAEGGYFDRADVVGKMKGLLESWNAPPPSTPRQGSNSSHRPRCARSNPRKATTSAEITTSSAAARSSSAARPG